MKNHYLNLLCGLFVAMVLMLSGCADQALQSGVMQLNKECPIDMGMMGTLEGVTYAGQQVDMNVKVNERIVSVSKMEAKADVIKEGMITFCSNPGAELQDFVRLLVDARVSLQVVYRGAESGQEFKLKLTPDELNDCLVNRYASAEDKLQAMVRSANVQMPMRLVNGISIREMTVDADSVFYYYDVNATVIDMQNMLENVEASKQATLQSMTRLGKVEKNDMMKIVEAGKMLGYRFEGDNGQVVTYFITCDELRQALGQ